MAEPYTKCGKHGDRIWQRNRYGQISYPYHRPKNPRTPAQQVVRANWKIVSPRWRTLPEAARQSWGRSAKHQKSRRRLGKQHRLKGYYYYMRINVMLLNRGQPMMDLPPEGPPPAALFFPLQIGEMARQLVQSIAAAVPPASPAPPDTG